MKSGVGAAFVLGAGLGTRLMPLTERRPKPLVPVFGRPLITFAFDHLMRAGVDRLVVNTHHCPEAYSELLGEEAGRATYRGREVRFRHEPLLLDTGGGIRNVQDLLNDGPFLLHNGDVLADLDLGHLVTTHVDRGNEVTLALRSGGGPQQVAWDEDAGRVVDIRGTLGVPGGRRMVYTGIAVLSSTVFEYLEPGIPHSVVPAWLKMIAEGRRVGGVALDEGLWMDLGTPGSYFQAHRELASRELSYATSPGLPFAIDPGANIGTGCELAGFNVVGAGARVGEGTRLQDCILWPGAETASRIDLRDCIVRAVAGESAHSTIF